MTGAEGWVANLWLIWAERRMISRVVGIALVAAVIVALFLPPTYECNASLMPPDSGSAGGLLSAMLAAKAPAIGLLAGDLLQSKSNTAVFQAILQSRKVEDDLVAQFNLQKVYGKKHLIDAARKLDENTDIDEDRKSGVLKIVVRDHDRYRSRDLTLAYVDQLNQLLSSLSTSSARRERIFLEDRLSSVKHNLETSEKNLAAFSSKNATFDPKEQGKALTGAAVSLEANLIAAQTQLQGLKEIYTDDNFRVRSMEGRVAELKKQLGKLGGVSTEESGKSAEGVFPSIRELPVLGVTYADLYREAQVNEAVFELLTQQYEMAKIQEAKEIPTAKVLDPPQVPEKPVGPPRIAIVFATVLCAFVGTILWIFSRESWRRIDSDQPFKVFAREVTSVSAGRLRGWSSKWPLRRGERSQGAKAGQ